METLLLLYRQTLAVDIKDTLQQANAYTLQRKLYEQCDVFGQLCKYDVFQRAFGVPPTPCESVSFIRFWRGVEDALTGPDPALTGPLSFELQKALFVDDDHLRGMRVFRDELLKHSSPLTLAAFYSVIDSCSKNVALGEFWSRVHENSRRTFDSDFVDLVEVSDMIFGHLSRHFGKVAVRATDLRTLSTCISFECEADRELPGYASGLSISSNPISNRSVGSAEDRYRKLLADLDEHLPAMYNSFCDKLESLSARTQHLEAECEHRDRLLEELKSDHESSTRCLQSRCEKLQESNERLQREVESKDLQMEGYRAQMDSLKRRMETSDPSGVEAELQAYMKRCAGLEHSNMRLRSSLAALERSIPPARFCTSDRVDACVGADDFHLSALAGSSVPVPESWPSPEERAETLNELATYKSENAELNATIAALRKTEKVLSTHLEAARRERDAAAEQLLKVPQVPPAAPSAEEEALTARVLSLESDLSSMRREMAALQMENESASSECNALLKSRSELERELALAKSAFHGIEREADQLRQRCAQLEASAVAATVELQRQLDDANSRNTELLAKLGAASDGNVALVTGLGTLKNPLSPASTATALTAGDKDDVCSTLSGRSDTTECEDSDRPGMLSGGVGVGSNVLRINPALAETRRLNTLNAVKHGHIRVGSAASPARASFPSSEPSGVKQGSQDTVVRRRVFEIQRSITTNEEGVDMALVHDPVELGVADSETASLSDADEGDVLQIAAA